MGLEANNTVLTLFHLPDIKTYQESIFQQMRDSEMLVPHVFFFLVLLSYEKFQSKTVISMPKIIQLCDGLMASGQSSTTHGTLYSLFTLPGSGA